MSCGRTVVAVLGSGLSHPQHDAPKLGSVRSPLPINAALPLEASLQAIWPHGTSFSETSQPIMQRIESPDITKPSAVQRFTRFSQM
jgi:hypothetical protein